MLRRFIREASKQVIARAPLRWITVVIDDLLPVSQAAVSSAFFPIYKRGTLLFCRPGENQEDEVCCSSE